MTINISSLKVFLLWCYIPLDFLTSHWFLHVVKPQAVFTSVQSLSLSRVQLFATSWSAAHQASLSIISSQSYSNSCPLSWWCHSTISSSATCFSFCLQLSPASVFSNESALCIRWPKYRNFSISPSNEYSGLISFRIDWFDLAVQRTLKSLHQGHNSKAAILWHSAFLMVQLSHICTWLLGKP